jgi:hypothetical protein
MSEHIYTYRNNTFNINQADDYTLLLQIDADLFSYAIIHDKQLLALDINCSLNELTDPQEFFEQLTANYKKTVIGLPANGFTLVPASLYSPENYIIYKLDGKIVSLAQKYAANNLVYSNTGWISAIAQSNPLNHNIYLNADRGKADFLCFKDGKLHFYNSFEYKNTDDIAYYTAFVTEELSLDPQNINLFLSGDPQSEDKTISRLKDFFPAVTFNNLQLFDLPEQLASHELLSLIALSLCGSSEAL